MRLSKLNIILGALIVSLSACDDHIEFQDNSMKVGDVLCTDGYVHSFDAMKELGKTPAAVVFHVNYGDESVGKGYAVYLHDLASGSFADSLGIKQGTSADTEAFDGNTNTFAMLNSKAGSPIATSVFDVWHYGQSAYIGSVAEMRLLYQNKREVNRILGFCGGDQLPDFSDECWYWTSSEVKGQESAKAWLFSMGSGTFHETPKDERHKVRPIVEIFQ